MEERVSEDQLRRDRNHSEGQAHRNIVKGRVEFDIGIHVQNLPVGGLDHKRLLEAVPNQLETITKGLRDEVLACSTVHYGDALLLVDGSVY